MSFLPTVASLSSVFLGDRYRKSSRVDVKPDFSVAPARRVRKGQNPRHGFSCSALRLPGLNRIRSVLTGLCCLLLAGAVVLPPDLPTAWANSEAAQVESAEGAAESAGPQSAAAADDAKSNAAAESDDPADDETSAASSDAGTATDNSAAGAQAAPDAPANDTRPSETEGTFTANPTELRLSRDIEYTVGLNDIGRLAEVIPQTINVSQDGLAGEIGLSAVRPYTVQSIYETKARQVDRELVLDGLPDNDVARLQQILEFEVSAATVPGATQLKELELASVEFEITTLSELELPLEYRAWLIYRGSEEYLELSAYLVTAHYEGVLAGAVPATIPSALAPAASADLATLEPGFDWLPLAGTAGAAVAVVVLLIWLFQRWINLRLVRSGVPGQRQKVLLKRHLRSQGGLVKLQIPARIELRDPGDYAFLLRPSLASRQGFLEVGWRGSIIARLPLASRIEFNLLDLYAQSAGLLLAQEAAPLAQALSA